MQQYRIGYSHRKDCSSTCDQIKIYTKNISSKWLTFLQFNNSYFLNEKG